MLGALVERFRHPGVPTSSSSTFATVHRWPFDLLVGGGGRRFLLRQEPIDHGIVGRSGDGIVRGATGTTLSGWVGRRLRLSGWRPGGVGLLVGVHVHVPPNGVRWVGSPDWVESSFGWVLPGCGIAKRPLPRLVHRRCFTVL
jgi:hypothetical protein